VRAPCDRQRNRSLPAGLPGLLGDWSCRESSERLELCRKGRFWNAFQSAASDRLRTSDRRLWVPPEALPRIYYQTSTLFRVSPADPYPGIPRAPIVDSTSVGVPKFGYLRREQPGGLAPECPKTADAWGTKVRGDRETVHQGVRRTERREGCRKEQRAAGSTMRPLNNYCCARSASASLPKDVARTV